MQLRIFVLGFVQGVGFRRFIKKKAIALGLTGWVKNLPDGRVEIVAQGDRENQEELVKIAKKGNIFSSVKDVVVVWEELEENYKTFDIHF